MVRLASRIAARALLALILLTAADRLVAAAETSRGCDGFATQEAAQAALDADLTDPGHLDTDFDGLACEPDQRAPVPREAAEFASPGRGAASAPATAGGDAAAARAVFASSDGLPAAAMRATVVGIIDGQTITVEIADPADPAFGETRVVRLAGIAAGAGAVGGTGCFVEESAHRFAVMLPPGRTVYLEAAVDPGAAGGETYVWFRGKDDGKPYLANEILVREGFAVVATPDSQHMPRLAAAQADAAAAGSGLWASCPGVAETVGSSG
jgi:micrococcal nuclease